MSAKVSLGDIAEFQRHEQAMLAVINSARHGAELFIADPFRFLEEHGYVVSAALQAQMEHAAPALGKSPKNLYDGIAAGRTKLAADSKVEFSWRIRSLGVKL